MTVTHQIRINLLRQEKTTIIDAVQNDKYARKLAITLYAGDEVWKPPKSTHFSIRYIKADGYGGEYDTLPDSTSGWMLEGNLLTITLAPQVLTTAGLVQMDVVMTVGTAELSTFQILINVHTSVGMQLTESENYHYGSGFLPMPSTGAVGDFLRISEVNAQGVIVDTEGVDMEEYLSGYSFLPDVTSADAGKVLRVGQDGTWAPEYFTAFVTISQAEYDALAAGGNTQADVLYMIVGDGS